MSASNALTSTIKIIRNLDVISTITHCFQLIVHCKGIAKEKQLYVYSTRGKKIPCEIINY